jgi:hypothetical protein
MNRRLKGAWIAAGLVVAALAGPAALGAMKRVEVRTFKADLPAANSVARGGSNDLASQPVDAPATASVPGPVAGAAPYRRLPSGYGELSLSDRQRDRIYALRGGYRARIEQLEAELAALKAAETEACESVLTVDQLEAFQRGKKTAGKAAKP